MSEAIINNLASILGGITILGLIVISYFREKKAETKGYDKALKELSDSAIETFKRSKYNEEIVSKLTPSEQREFGRTGVFPISKEKRTEPK